MIFRVTMPLDEEIASYVTEKFENLPTGACMEAWTCGLTVFTLEIFLSR